MLKNNSYMCSESAIENKLQLLTKKIKRKEIETIKKQWDTSRIESECDKWVI